MNGLTASGPDEEVLDVIIGTPETEVGIRRSESEVACLRELPDWQMDRVRLRTERGRNAA